MIDPPTYLTTVFCLFAVLSVLVLLMLATAIRIVPEMQRLSVFRLGRYIGEKGPGLVILIPFIDRGVPIHTRDQVKRAQELGNLWGAVGETLTAVHTDGSVKVSGETWQAASLTPIPPGARVRVKRVLLEVEEI